MSENEYKVGMIIKSPEKPEFGPGKVIRINGNSIWIYFRNDNSKYARQYSKNVARLNRYKKKSDQFLNSLNEKNFVDTSIGLLYEPSIIEKCKYFCLKPKLKSIDDLNIEHPPSQFGVYGWYFDEPPPYVPTNGCTSVKTGSWPFRTKWWLLYVGKAKSLSERIVTYHIGGGHYAKRTMSSLRLSLGCLLSKKLGILLYYPPESFGKKEKKLNNWLEKHALITWVRTAYIDEVETCAIQEYYLPLNYEHNNHPLVQPLSNLRKAFRKIVKSSDRKGKKKRKQKKAYKQFVNDCKRLKIEK